MFSLQIFRQLPHYHLPLSPMLLLNLLIHMMLDVSSTFLAVTIFKPPNSIGWIKTFLEIRCFLSLQIKLVIILSKLIRNLSLRGIAEDNCKRCGITNDLMITSLPRSVGDQACQTFKIFSIMLSFSLQLSLIIFYGSVENQLPKTNEYHYFFLQLLLCHCI